MIGKIGRYWHTLRHLKPVQFYRRALFRLPTRLDLRPPVVARREHAGSWQAPIARARSLVGPFTLELLGVTHQLPDAGGWDDERIDKLRRYNLHYFDGLSAPDCAEGQWDRGLIERWIAENPPTTGTGWEPYPVSLRIVNWIKWLECGNIAPAGMIGSLALQARWLARRLEWHLLGNHLFVNAKALLIAGCFFDGPEADRWRQTGQSIITAELAEQVLGDGGHFELSPMYHAIFIEDVLDLLNAGDHWPGLVPAQVLAEWRDIAGRMLDFLSTMTHPDGEVSYFNDAAVGVAPDLSALQGYARRLGVAWAPPGPRPLTVLADSGYIRVERGPAVVLLDVARVGPDYLPGHAHADTLSFELSLDGGRLIVNGGTSEYGVGPIRLAERGTATHSTVTVDDRDSSEVWSGFRVARRARPFDLDVTESDAAVSVGCSHDGYKRLPGRPVHRRSWRIVDRGLQVEDLVAPSSPATARYLLAPDVTATPLAAGGFSLARDGAAIATVGIEQGSATLAPAFFAPRFGTRVPTSSIAVELIDGRAAVRFEWL